MEQWTELETTGIWVPVRAVPKERPQVSHGKAYYTDRYLTFRSDVTEALRVQGVKPSGIAAPVEMELSFKTDGFHLQLRPIKPTFGGVIARPTHVRGDADNLAGGVMDSLEDGGYLENDRWVHELHTRLWEER